ncbi:Endosomal spry domain-containing protein [Rutstroemia sp. NJR-2017a BBW]|nr:Endosomal spry domain-containing protein [Rutstroemia sp. NJR-2017a BBW]
MSEVREKSRKKSRLRGGDLGDVPESEYGDDIADLRAYRHEKPARVGGMNKESDSTIWEGSTNPEGSTVSDGLMENRERSPPSSPEKPKKPTKDQYKIRKVVGTVYNPAPSTTTTSSFWDNHKSTRKTQRDADTTDDERIKAEARKLQEKGRAAQRRDFSFRVGDDHSAAGSGTSLISARDAAAERERERREREERRARREARRQKGSGTETLGSGQLCGF